MVRYAITERCSLPGDETARRLGLFAQAQRWTAQKLDYIQLREKDLSPAELEHIASAITATIRSTGSATRLLVNGPPSVALAAGADGVHLPSASEFTPANVHQIFIESGRQPPVVSISCHTLEEVRRARREQADLILFGPVFGKAVAGKPVSPAVGLEALQAACEAAGDTPVLALGGVTAENTQSCLEAGAKGIAAIRLFAMEQA